MNYRADLLENYDLYDMVPEFITVHTTRNLKKGANAAMHARYLKSIDTSKKCWHVTVDDKEGVQHLPFSVNAWSCGDGEEGTGNRKSIQIEICENEDGDFDKAVKHAQLLINRFMKEYKIPLKNVVPHKKWSGKDCPHVLLPKWNEFIKGVAAAGRVQDKKEVPGTLYRVQVGAFSDKENAQQLLKELNKKGYPAFIR